MSKPPIIIDELSQEEQELWHQLDGIETPSPSSKMKTEFYTMLHSFETGKETNIGFWQKWKSLLLPDSWLRVAYISLLMLSAGFIGFGISEKGIINSGNQSKVQQLSDEVREMKEMMMLAMLQNPQATERIKAVSYTKEFNEIDNKILAALITTFREDENDNVRMVALNALIKLSAEPQVRETLVGALMQEKSPLIQAALADAMLKLQEKKSIGKLKQKLKEAQLNKFVKEKFEKTIEKLST